MFPDNFVVLDESSKIKTNTPMKECDKSTRTRLIKLLGQYAKHKCIMTGTLMSKSPLNVIDQYAFLKDGYIPEDMYSFAEKYCVMMTLHTRRGQRVLISKKIYDAIRARLVSAYKSCGDAGVYAVRERINAQYGVRFDCQSHIMMHKAFTPFRNVEALMKRLEPDTLFVRREDVFDVQFDKFVKEPIQRPVTLSAQAKKIANELVKIGFTDNFTLGRAPALELLIRLQDICNGFEPVSAEQLECEDLEKICVFDESDRRKNPVHYRAFTENPKIEELMELLGEIGTEENQVVVWCSRKLMIRACKEAFDKEDIPYVVYDGSASAKEKQEAEGKFKSGEARIFLANQASGAYGLNCLSACSYAVYMCVDGSVEKYYQSMHRILRGQLISPKFAYAIYAKGTVEERQWDLLRVGKELIDSDNREEKFLCV
jgi:hypothetical protein